MSSQATDHDHHSPLPGGLMLTLLYQLSSAIASFRHLRNRSAPLRSIEAAACDIQVFERLSTNHSGRCLSLEKVPGPLVICASYCYPVVLKQPLQPINRKGPDSLSIYQ